MQKFYRYAFFMVICHYHKTLKELVCLFHSKNVGESEASRYMGSETNLPHLRWTSLKKNPCAVERLSGVLSLDKRIRKGFSRFELLLFITGID